MSNLSGARQTRVGWIAILATLLLAPIAHAQSHATSPRQNQTQKRTTHSANSGVDATVTTDGAIVFAQPDQDSTIITQLPLGSRVRVSRGTTTGEDRFRKIKIHDRVGYISDIDVRIGDAPAAKSGSKKAAAKAHAKTKKHRPERDAERLPIYFSRFVGLLVGASEFKEGISGVNSSTTFPIYGLKITGPDVLLSGPVMDLNLALHYGAPDYYDALSAGRPTGFVLFGDASFEIPVVNNQNFDIYLGTGPLLVLSRFTVLNANRVMDLTSLNLGAVFTVGTGIRIQKVAFRLEARYLLEKQSYKSLQAALQTEF